jgi:antitoxin component YwqK of YwqJK toxin-antitoxin module
METFYEDGSPYESGQIDKGLRTGKWTMNYSGMDQVAVESNFANGKLEGVQTSYAMDGYVQVQGAYVADKRNGEWKWFSSDGVIESVVTFVDGKKNGDQLFYNTYSDLLKTEVYKDGKLIETKVEE